MVMVPVLCLGGWIEDCWCVCFFFLLLTTHLKCTTLYLEIVTFFIIVADTLHLFQRLEEGHVLRQVIRLLKSSLFYGYPTTLIAPYIISSIESNCAVFDLLIREAFNTSSWMDDPQERGYSAYTTWLCDVGCSFVNHLAFLPRLYEAIGSYCRTRLPSNARDEEIITYLRHSIKQCHATEDQLRKAMNDEVTRHENACKALKEMIINQKTQLNYDRQGRAAETKKRAALSEKCKELEKELDKAKEEVRRERSLRKMLEDGATAEVAARVEIQRDEETIELMKEQLVAAKKARDLALRIKGTEKQKAATAEADLRTAREEIQTLRQEGERLRKRLEQLYAGGDITPPGEEPDDNQATDEKLQKRDNENATVSRKSLTAKALRAELTRAHQDMVLKKKEYKRILEQSTNIQNELRMRVEELQQELAVARINLDAKEINGASNLRVLVEHYEADKVTHIVEECRLRERLAQLEEENTGLMRVCEDMKENCMSIMESTGLRELSLGTAPLNAPWNGAPVPCTDDIINELNAAVEKERKRADDLAVENISLQSQLTTRLESLDVLCEQLKQETRKAQDSGQQRDLTALEVTVLRHDLDKMTREKDDALEELTTAKDMVTELNVEVKELWEKMEKMEMEKAVSKLVDESSDDLDTGIANPGFAATGRLPVVPGPVYSQGPGNPQPGSTQTTTNLLPGMYPSAGQHLRHPQPHPPVLPFVLQAPTNLGPYPPTQGLGGVVPNGPDLAAGIDSSQQSNGKPSNVQQYRPGVPSGKGPGYRNRGRPPHVSVHQPRAFGR